MARILRLDQNTINKIAAGEVVERPAAVVKELVENAIDAGATAITIEIKQGGSQLIRITDNGSGIEKEQIQIAFERHATSKIREAQDLLTIHSLGFRGEALASISAVAQVELVTKTRGTLMGVRYVIEGGEEKKLEDVGCPEGTTFVIRNLFYNVPARKKFLKSPQTETSYVNDLVERMAMSHPHISFKFMSNNQVKLQTSGNGNNKDVIYHIYGRDITSQLLSITSTTALISVTGFLAKPVVNRGNRNYMNYFVNGRYVKSKIVNKAIEEAYKPYMMQHRYPMTALQIEIDSQQVDVNVHPTKMEVRFSNEQAVFQAIFQAITNGLAHREMIPAVTVGKEEKNKKAPLPANKGPEPFEVQRKIAEGAGIGKQKLEAAKLISQYEKIKKEQEAREHVVKEENTYKTESFSSLAKKALMKVEQQEKEKKDNSTTVEQGVKKQKEQCVANAIKEDARKYKSNPARNEIEKNITTTTENASSESKTADVEKEKLWDKNNSTQVELFEGETALLKKEAKKEYTIVGQIFDTYWIVQYKDKMFLIDQHAAHEKILFERTIASIKEKKRLSQMLQPPMIVSLSMKEEQVLKKHKAAIEALGFEVETFGGREYSIRAVPANLFDVADVTLLTDLLDTLAEDMQVENSDVIIEKVASISCKAAVKGNMKLSKLEAEALITELMQLENPYHCPHGRPVIVSMSKYELEKKFKRVL